MSVWQMVVETYSPQKIQFFRELLYPHSAKLRKDPSPPNGWGARSKVLPKRSVLAHQGN